MTALNFLTEDSFNGNPKGLRKLSDVLRKAHTRRVNMAIIGNSQKATMGNGYNTLNAFYGILYGTYGNIPGTGWMPPTGQNIAAIGKGGTENETSRVAIGTPGGFTVPGLMRQSGTGDHFVQSMSSTGADTGTGYGMAFSAASVVGNMGWSGEDTSTSDFYFDDSSATLIDASEGGVWQVATVTYPGIASDAYMGLVPREATPANGPLRSGASRSETVHVDVSGNAGTFGTGYHVYECPSAAPDSGDIPNIQIRGGQGDDSFPSLDSSPGVACYGWRYKANVARGIELSTFSVGGYDMDAFSVSHANCGPGMSVLYERDGGEPEITLIAIDNNDSDITAAQYKTDLEELVAWIRGFWPSTVIVVATDPESTGYASNADENGQHYTKIKEVVEAEGTPMVALNVRKHTHLLGWHPSGGLAAGSSSPTTLSDGVHWKKRGGEIYAETVWKLMSAAAGSVINGVRRRAYTFR